MLIGLALLQSEDQLLDLLLITGLLPVVGHQERLLKHIAESLVKVLVGEPVDHVLV